MKLAYVPLVCMLGLGIALPGPALALYDLAHVPSLWPADAPFESGDQVPLISTKGAIAKEVTNDSPPQESHAR